MNYIESETIELKSIFTDEIKKEVTAFANTRGGIIYVGIENDGQVCGVDNPDYVIRQISNSVRDSIKPDVTMFINYRTLTEQGKNIVEVNIQCGTHRPYYINGKGIRPEGVYVRQGTSSVPASELLIRKMIKETDGDIYEDMRSLNQDLTFNKAREEFRIRNINLEESQMRTLGIIDNDGLYTNLALLLSDQCPHIIKVASFNGVDNQNFHDRNEFSGSLLKQLEDAYSYIDLRNNTSATFSGLLRTDHRDYPETALREALLNAIVHRDYSVSAATLISVYSNRLEMISIGGLAGISYDDMMLGVSYCRNKKLAEIFYRLKLIESYGTGIGKIMTSYKDFPQKPEINVTTGAFKIVLFNTSSSIKEEQAETREDSREQKLINLFKKKQQLTRADIEKELNISLSTASRLLRKLIADGYITSTGHGRQVSYKLKLSD